ncbi:MAG: hypothetical protein DMF87_01905 [Acidobacteria bacterium]|nr:MAG: hypothetical protein DMF87_01905 [Acidobacteriota bacterium]
MSVSEPATNRPAKTARSRYFLNRGGRNLSATRRAELERAKRILQRRAAARKCTTKKR